MPPQDWKQVSFCGVTFYLPPDFGEATANMEDSCFVRFQHKNITLYVDIPYSIDERESRRRKYADKRDLRSEGTMIDGRKGEVITFYETAVSGTEKDLNYRAVLYIPGVANKSTSLTISTYNRSAAEQGLSRKIFASVKFNS